MSSQVFYSLLCCPDRFLLPSFKETHALDWKMSIFLHQLGNILPQFVTGVNSIAEIKHGGNDIERALRFQVRKLVRQPCIMRISRLGRTLHHISTPEAGVMGNDVTQVCYRFISFYHILKTTSICKDMIHRVALHVPPVGFQSEVADAFEAFRSESLVTEQHPAILKQFNLLLYCP